MGPDYFWVGRNTPMILMNCASFLKISISPLPGKHQWLEDHWWNVNCACLCYLESGKPGPRIRGRCWQRLGFPGHAFWEQCRCLNGRFNWFKWAYSHWNKKLKIKVISLSYKGRVFWLTWHAFFSIEYNWTSQMLENLKTLLGRTFKEKLYLYWEGISFKKW